ncbi:MAG: glycosyl hydrolase 53 family protein [Balneolaceae bacterium]|nr:glycosyl hydrolase 53 family protein [Balneolaceae bacterium]
MPYPVLLQKQDQSGRNVGYDPGTYIMGADLSYVNQVLDHGGTYRDSGRVENPYRIFREHGTNTVRLRLWHDPEWVRTEAYETQDKPLYSGLHDVTESIRRTKEQGMMVVLDFHYSDIWADPNEQRVPEAWQDITSLKTLVDSVYQYTRRTLYHLAEQDLLPEMVQVGNEINCGMLYSDVPPSFPDLEVCKEDSWYPLGRVINSGIRAVREVSGRTGKKIKIILHVAQPENVDRWFRMVTNKGEVRDFDILGFSYYPKWSTVTVDQIDQFVTDFRNSYNREVMIMETAYAWTLNNADQYGNILGNESLLEPYSATPAGQRQFMTDLTSKVIAGGGTGIFYWEPAWISSGMKDLWGEGSSWENSTFFDFDGNLHEGIDYMTYPYDFPEQLR